MNAYDFDKTIYQGDSSIDFYLYCIKRHPQILKMLPQQAKAGFLYKLGRIDKRRFKEGYFAFLRRLENPAEDVIGFWDENQKKIQNWYLELKAEDDLVISASPAFLLREICGRLSIRNLIASEVDIATGIFSGANCKGMEKVRRFRELYGNSEIENFYSDSLSDSYMADISKNAFLVNGNRILTWDLNGERKK